MILNRRYSPLALIFLVLAACFLSSSALANEKADDLVYHTVQADDTLGSIALKYDVRLSELQGWNGIEGIIVEPGTTLIVKSSQKIKARPTKPLPVIHVVRSGDTFEGIAKKYRVTVKQVQQWNRRINPRRIQIGAQVRLHIPGADGKSVSWGAANGGRLYNGVAMPTTPGLRVRNTARAYGTERTVRLLKAVGADMKARWPDAPELVVGSLSMRSGGRMRPHKSHQSGRDVDINYYHRGNVTLPDFRDMSVETFDAVKNWHLFKTLIDSGQTEFIFVDYRLQKVLHEYALSIGYTEEELVPILQYPAPQQTSTGIIRHSRGHLNHFHLRFICGPEDRNCR